jgi:hypothetical protein
MLGLKLLTRRVKRDGMTSSFLRFQRPVMTSAGVIPWEYDYRYDKFVDENFGKSYPPDEWFKKLRTIVRGRPAQISDWRVAPWINQ